MGSEETFTLLGKSWDVKKAERIVSDGRATVPVSVAEASALAGLIRIDKDYALTTDLERPIILTSLRDTEGNVTHLIIDGWHRIYRAHHDGVQTLKAFVLTEEEDKEVRVT